MRVGTSLANAPRMPPKLDNKVIARFVDGTLVRGITFDFNPAKAFFHVDDGKESRRININELKALFFVRDFSGNPEYQDKKGFFTSDVHGKKIMVEFRDGETLFGFTLSYTSRGLGFFVFPGDPDSNNEKVFIVHGATRRIKLCSPTGSFTEPSSTS